MTKFSFTNKLLVAGAGATLVFASSPSQAAVINISDFTGWQQIGNVSLINNQQVTLSSTGGVSDSNIESFLGLANGTLDASNFQNVTNGSAIRNTIAAQAGDVLRFDWQFQTNDYLPFNDFSFYSIGSSLYELADVRLVGNFGQTASQTSFTFTTAGTYTVGFGVANTLDELVSSNLTVGSAAINESVPEPITIIGSLTAGAFGVALRRKKKQQQKANSEA
ncbi:PEP-CTERM sorting domain-containing protein [Fortiea sp. LEGE XX443]|uniref:PEP-CTERM sorting domain-containing protein n=1 Tax=Fortiea sp. LEGE XX443 TaxID=1828611 RepID=UPI0018814B59|nr:PEP-CTERM sorting domain-containing protein [Fortiea sp. LEGE XX443]MBE9007834.1 PEP-CTERM sorting domain-containing protein [Fortiea sp. LEGE XX443]